MQIQQFWQIDMTDTIPLPSLHHQNGFEEQSHKKQNCCTPADSEWIQHLLSLSAFTAQSPNHTVPPLMEIQRQIFETLQERKQQCVEISKTFKPQISILHNFQKHLITLLKKIAVVNKTDFINKRAGVRAYDLWRIFKQQKNFSKKSLFLAFGVAESCDDCLILRLAQQIPQFCHMLQKYGLEEIECAQILLRRLVFSKVRRLSKEAVKAQCRMAKFQEFYSYFVHFIAELQGEGLCKRLRKQDKNRLFSDNSE